MSSLPPDRLRRLIAKRRHSPIAQGRRVKLAVLPRQADNELRDRLAFYLVGADFQSFYRGGERFAHF